MYKILVIEDDVSFCKMLEHFLVKKSFEVTTAFSAEEGKIKAAATKFDVILTDLRLPDDDGLSLVAQFKNDYPGVPVILMTGYSDIGTAVKAIKNGAADYISKPFNPDEVLLVVKNAIAAVQPAKAITPSNVKLDAETIAGISAESKKLEEHIKLVGPTNMSVLIIGESGTGKEVTAKKIHDSSLRRDNNFIAIDCGTISKELATSEFFGHVRGSFTGAITDKMGYFEAANNGTLFLDEIGNLSYENQIQLLRALQERKIKPVGSNKEIPVDIRVITATNEDLRDAVRNGDFREDLYHRINEFSIHSPALKDRAGDLMIFAEFFLQKANHQLNKEVAGFSPDVIAVFESYHWPGNLREMQNIIKRAVLLTKGEFINRNVLPDEIFEIRTSTSSESLQETERDAIISALNRTQNNKTEAAKLLKITRKTLYNKINLYRLEL